MTCGVVFALIFYILIDFLNTRKKRYDYFTANIANNKRKTSKSLFWNDFVYIYQNLSPKYFNKNITIALQIRYIKKSW